MHQLPVGFRLFRVGPLLGKFGNVVAGAEGPVAGAAAKFPANVNVAVALGFAGIGPENTQFEIWADPGVTRNTHTIKVEADAANFEMTIGVVPTEENPATGKLVALSVMDALRGLVTTFRVGT